MEKEKLVNLIEQGFSVKKISKTEGITVGKVRWCLKKYNLKSDGINKIYTWDKEKIKDAIEKSECKSDVLRFLGITLKSGNFQTLDRYIKKYDLESSNLVYKNDRGSKWVSELNDEEVFCVNSPLQTGKIKRRILKKKLIEYKCEKCKNDGTWMGEVLILQLDHRNGINDDHRLENLRFLCPNCHSQTETFCRSNKNIVVNDTII